MLTCQSSLLNGRQIAERIETFIKEMVGTGDICGELDSMSEDQFLAFKQGIQQRKLEPDQRLTAQAGRFWGEITYSLFHANEEAEEPGGK